jgi:hypothetical protein
MIVLERTPYREQVPTPALGRILVCNSHIYLSRDAFHDSAVVFYFILHSPHAFKTTFFLTISTPNGLELNNIASKATVEELREQIFPMWPTGIARQESNGRDWRVSA